MSSSELMKDAVQTASATIAVITNVFLIYLIIKKSPKKLGNYKVLMIYFAIISIFLSLLEFFLMPYFHTVGNCIAVIVKSSVLLQDGYELILVALSCGVAGMTMSMFAVHFIYRCFALERKGRLAYFQGFRIIGWVLVPIAVGLIWGLNVFIFLGHDSTRMANYMGDSLLETYGLNVSEIVFIGAFYYPIDENGKETVNSFAFIGMAVLAVIMTISLFVVCYFGKRSFKKIRRLDLEGKSEFTKSLQKQLFNALVLQTILPLLFVFTPLGLFFFLPILNIDIQIFSQLANLTLAVYPALDPLPTIFMIDNYRKAVKELFYDGSCTTNHVGPAEYEARSEYENEDDVF